MGASRGGVQPRGEKPESVHRIVPRPVRVGLYFYSFPKGTLMTRRPNENLARKKGGQVFFRTDKAARVCFC